MASERPSFLKKLSPKQALVNLPIPQAFARSYMKHIHENQKVTLLTPLDKFWHVSIKKSDGDCLYLSNGWQEFALAYELDEGDTDLFKYEGNRLFSSSGCSIDYYTSAARKVTIETQNLQNFSDKAAGKKKNLRTDHTKNGNVEMPILKEQPEVEETVLGMELLENRNGPIRLDRTVKHCNLTKGFMVIPASFLSTVGLRMKGEESV